MRDVYGAALITGASSGIGLELARLFARDRWELVLVARRADALEALAGELRPVSGQPVHVIVSDLARLNAAAELVENLQQRGIQIDALVNNAGTAVFGPFVNADWELHRQTIQLNVTCLTELSRGLLPGMIERRRGWILNVASTAAFQPGPLLAVYFATKAYIL
ncbi:MAG TPA: SDR family NAD(P)-dependent oxidoreductase, partial [Pirellulales bacterium]|nr:SDR family NAD(P)-dependent oxidoreductase [Pirellulales bacterium]